MDPIVIVGSGLAGWTLAREFRKLDSSTPVTLVSADGGDFYSKPMLSNALAQGKSADQLITTPGAHMARQLGVDLRARTRISALDVAARRVCAEDGTAIGFSRLVLALGADPVRLPLEGDAADQVLSVNDLDDYARFRAALNPGARVAIIGAGLIGCEFANDLAGAGFPVTVLDPATRPLASLLPAPAGLSLVQPLASIGIDWRLGIGVTGVDRTSRGFQLALTDGSATEASVVLSAVGLRPRTSLARAAGIAVNRGIVVDAHLQTSAAGIHAIGDCAEVDGQVRPYVLPIMHAARALAQTLAGSPTPVRFPPMPVVIKTPACPIVVQPPPTDVDGDWEVDTGPGGLKLVFHDAARRPRGFALTGGRTAERQALTRALAD